MIGCQHVVFGNVLHAEIAVGCRVVELGRVDQAGFHRRLDFTARQLNNRHAHFQHNVCGQTNGPVLEALHLRRICDLLVEPTKRLCRHRRVEERNNVQAQLCHQFVKQFLTATRVDPAQHFL